MFLHTTAEGGSAKMASSLGWVITLVLLLGQATVPVAPSQLAAGRADTDSLPGSRSPPSAPSARPPPPCNLCTDNNWVFIVSSGRSGSTSIMHMLNTIPGYYIAGENAGMVEAMSELYLRANQTGFEAKDDGFDAWYHHQVHEDKLLCTLQQYARQLIGDYPDDTVAIGWKEFRYRQPWHLAFMLKLFPCAKFIVNVRLDVNALHRSTFMRNKSTRKLEMLSRMVQKFKANNPQRTANHTL